MRNSTPIRRYFSLRFGIVALLPVVIIAVFVGLYVMPDMQANVGIQHQGTAQIVAGQISAHLLGGERQFRALANYLDQQTGIQEQQLTDILNSQCGNGELFETIYLSSIKDRFIISVGLAKARRLMHDDFLGLDLNGRNFIHKARLLGKAVWSETFLSTASSKFAVALTVPMTDSLLTAEITLDKLSELISLFPVKAGIQIIVLDQNGRIVADSQRKNWGRKLNLSTLPQLKSEGETDYTSSPFELDSRKLIGTMVNIDRLGWNVLVAQPEEIAFAALQSSIIAIVVVLAIALLFALILSWFQASKLSLLMQSYAKRAQSIAHGEYHLTWPRSNTTELIDLGRSLENMARMIDQREKALTESETRLNITLDSIGDGVIATDEKGLVTLMNPMAEKLTGWSIDSAREKPLTEVFKIINANTRKTVESPVNEVITKGKVVDLVRNTILIAKDGSEYHIADSGAPIRQTDGTIVGVVLVFRDATEKVRMEEVMIQSEKMMSVGGLAAGMAHEINNPLSGMLQTASTMANRLQANRPIPANLKAAETAGTTIEAIEHYMDLRGIPRMIHTIITSGERVADIVNNMLSFARKSDASFSTYQLEDLLNKTVDLAATDYDLKKHYDFKLITIKKEYADNLPAVPCEGPMIQQVLLNIFTNGAQAMQSANVDKPQFILRTKLIEDRQMVEIEIEDNGLGIDENTRKRVFEPFFTTKPVGLGTGLGLSVSYFIITENHNGEMMVRSRLGAGTRFIIRLPVLK